MCGSSWPCWGRCRRPWSSPRCFDRHRHLEGYEECFLSEWHALYRFDEFDDREGEYLSESELRDLQRLWSLEIVRVEEEIERLRSDPEQLFLHRFERELSRHPYFSKVTLTREDAFRPIVLYLQAPARADPGHVSRLTQEYGPVLEAVESRFAREFAVPAGLRRRQDQPLFVAVVLPDKGSFRNYARASGMYYHLEPSAGYDHRLRAAVFHDSPFEPARTGPERLRSARHAFVHVLVQGHSPEGVEPPVESWLAEGLAVYLAEPVSDETSWRAALSTFVEAGGRDSPMARTRPPTVADLIDDVSFSGLSADLGARLRGGKVEEEHHWDAYLDRQRLAALFTRFLLGDDPGGHAGSALRLTEAHLSSGGRPEAFQASLADRDTRALVREFRDWLGAEYGAERPGSKALLGSVFPGELASRKSPGEPPPEEPALPPLEPEPGPVLVSDDPTAEDRLALALWKAREGRVQVALGLLGRALETADSASAERIGREIGRVEAWRTLRDAFLASVAADQGRLEYSREGERQRGDLVAYEAGVLRLSLRGGSTESVPADELEPVDVARQMARWSKGHASAWARSYPYLLAGDPKWKRILGRESEEELSLRTDAEGDYPSLLEHGEVLARLEYLAVHSAPSDADQARGLLERIRALRSRFGETVWVVERRPALLELAATCLTLVFEEEGPGIALRGATEVIEPGRVRLVYGFDDSSELADFEDVDYLAGPRSQLDELPHPRLDGFRVEGGSLVGNGAASLRHVLPLRAPLTVRYGFALGEQGTDLRAVNSFLALGVCDDGKERLALVFNGLYVWVLDSKGLQVSEAETVPFEYPGHMTEVSVEHDGESLEVTRDGVGYVQTPCGLTDGAVLLWLHTPVPISVDRLEIVGYVEGEGMRDLARLHAERELFGSR